LATGSTVCRNLQITRLVSGAAPKSPISQAGNEKSGRCAFGMSQLELFEAAALVPAAPFPVASQ